MKSAICNSLRYLAAAAAAALVLLVSGCAGPVRPSADTPPAIRVEGARILDADPEATAAQTPGESPAAPPLGPAPAKESPESVVPPDVAKGVKVSLDVVEARAGDVLRGLAYQGNVDLILMGGPEQRVTVHLQEAPWAKAFQAVLDGAGLMAQWEDRRVRILTPEQLRTGRESVDRLERLEQRTEVVPLQNLYAKDAAPTLTSVLSEGGRIGVDEEHNALVITDAPSRLASIRAALRDLDGTPPQVMIEAIIIDVTLNDELHAGFDWSAIRQGAKGVTLQQTLSVGAGTSALINPGATLGFTLAGNDWTLSAMIDMLQKQDNIKVLANPRVLAINNRKARIEIIDEIPYQELTQTQQGGQIGTTNFKEVGVKLEVTPRIAADGGVHLQLLAEQSSPTRTAINQIPVVQTRRSETIMTVRDGQIIAIGGLRRHRSTTNEDKVPLLGDVPLLGLLFRRVETVDVETELVIFIRPKIVRPGQALSARERTLADAINHVDRRPQVVRTDPLRRHVAQEADRRVRVPPQVVPGAKPAAETPPATNAPPSAE